MALNVWRKLLILFAISDIVIWFALYFTRNQVIEIYTKEPKIEKLTDYTIWITILVICEGHMKNSVMGIVKALEQQKKALYLNLCVYIVLTLPLAYCFAFVVQKYGILTDKDSNTNNRGVGIWIAFVVGAGIQTIGYLIIISLTDWQYQCEVSQERLNLSTKLFPSEKEEQFKNDNDDYERVTD